MKKINFFFTIEFWQNKLIKYKPYYLFLYTGLTLFLISLIVLKQNISVDIHLHDSYFVIALSHIFWFLASFSLIIWVFYLLVNKILYSKILIWVHIIVTIFALSIFSAILFLYESLIKVKINPNNNFRFLNPFDNYNTIEKFIGISIFVLVIGQFIFLINIIIGLFKVKATNFRL
jgi:heme/copper-type cytochrome/quinol oxidase subunit 1